MTEENLFIGIFIFMVVIGLVAIWNNWIVLDDSGFTSGKHPSFLAFYALGCVNLARVLTFRSVIPVRSLLRAQPRL